MVAGIGQGGVQLGQGALDPFGQFLADGVLQVGKAVEAQLARQADHRRGRDLGHLGQAGDRLQPGDQRILLQHGRELAFGRGQIGLPFPQQVPNQWSAFQGGSFLYKLCAFVKIVTGIFLTGQKIL